MAGTSSRVKRRNVLKAKAVKSKSAAVAAAKKPKYPRGKPIVTEGEKRLHAAMTNELKKGVDKYKKGVDKVKTKYKSTKNKLKKSAKSLVSKTSAGTSGRVARRTKLQEAAKKRKAMRKALPKIKKITYKSQGGGLKSQLKKRTAGTKPMKKITPTKTPRKARSPRKTGGARRR